MFKFIGNRRFLSAEADGGGMLPEEANRPEGEGTAGQEESQTEEGSADGDAQGPPEEPGGAPAPAESIDLNEIDERVKTAVAEELKKASMTEGERTEYELEQRQRQLDEREKTLAVREFKADTIRLLSEKGLPPEVADVVLGADMKETLQNVKRFKDCLDKEVQKQVAERLKGKTPGAGNVHPGEGDSVKAQFLRGLSGI